MKKSFKKTLSILLSALLICSMAFGLQIKPVIAEEAGSTDEVSFYENLSEAEFAEDDTITVLIELHVFQEIFGESRTCAYCGYSE